MVNTLGGLFMKKLILGFVIGISLGWLFSTYASSYNFYGGDSLARVEKLSSEELNKYRIIQQKVAEAQKELKSIEDAIAKSHNMSSESYMEWSTYYRIDGEYILLLYSSMHMFDIE